MAATGVRNARYKGRRLRDPLRMADQYVAIDELLPRPIFELASSDDANANAVQTYECRFDLAQFLPSSPLLNAFATNYTQYRCRSVTLTFESLNVDNVNPRYAVGCYWVPNHQYYDNGHDTAITSWTDFLEKPRTSIVTKAGGNGSFSLHYIPQVIDVEQEEEDDPELPPVQATIRSSQPYGWLPTFNVEQSFEHRSPILVFRKPYSAIPVNARVWRVSIRCIWEFRCPKTGV